MCDDRPMPSTSGTGGRRVGRPRATQRPDSGLSARDELLAAAAELFTTRGYAATTTRAVAERAGMRQATMYHYVAGKEDLLAALLESTVAPSLALAEKLLADGGRPAEDRLWELCRADVALLCGGPYNLGALYVLPEVRAERFADFRRVRAALRSAYGELLVATEVGAALDADEARLRADLVFGLIEGVILVHLSEPEREAEAFATATADAALRIVGPGREAGSGAGREG